METSQLPRVLRTLLLDHPTAFRGPDAALTFALCVPGSGFVWQNGPTGYVLAVSAHTPKPALWLPEATSEDQIRAYLHGLIRRDCPLTSLHGSVAPDHGPALRRLRKLAEDSGILLVPRALVGLRRTTTVPPDDASRPAAPQFDLAAIARRIQATQEAPPPALQTALAGHGVEASARRLPNGLYQGFARREGWWTHGTLPGAWPTLGLAIREAAACLRDGPWSWPLSTVPLGRPDEGELLPSLPGLPPGEYGGEGIVSAIGTYHCDWRVQIDTPVDPPARFYGAQALTDGLILPFGEKNYRLHITFGPQDLPVSALLEPSVATATGYSRKGSRGPVRAFGRKRLPGGALVDRRLATPLVSVDDPTGAPRWEILVARTEDGKPQQLFLSLPER